MMPPTLQIAALLFLQASSFAYASPTIYKSKAISEPNPSLAISVQIAGQTFINKGLVAFGLIPANFTDSTGNTMGGIGSAIAIQQGSFTKKSDGTFTGTLIVQPDRGYNVETTVDYQARQHFIDFTLSPYYDTSNLSFDDALNSLVLDYQKTILYYERDDQKTTGLDALAVRAVENGFPANPTSDPEMPIPSLTFNHLSTDAEGIALNSDGTFWVSEEYGPYIYLYDGDGNLLVTVEPPNAILPYINNSINFTSSVDPDTGRAANQGFEGLTLDSTGQTLYALLQSATIQDGGSDKSTSRYTRLLAYGVSDPLSVRPPLIGEWVVPLPQNSKGNTLAASELHYVSDNIFLVLARDGDGHGGSSDSSKYKQADLIDISSATDIHGTSYDEASTPISPNGKLANSITPAQYVGFVNYINSTQLARFGLHNGKPADQTLIDAKWESLELVSVDDSAFPHDYFLFTASDNDFMTTDGNVNGVPYNAGLDNDNQFLVFRLTLPTAKKGIFRFDSQKLSRWSPLSHKND